LENRPQIGKGHSVVLVTIVERVSKFTLSAQADKKTAGAATKATIKLLKPFKDVVHSFTAGNAKEFTYHGKSARPYQRMFILRIRTVHGSAG
jgi:IS30 family transposase